MEIEGVIVSILPLQTGQGRNGIWKKQEFVIETLGQYPRKVMMHLWGEKADEVRLTIGERIKASVNIESREYNGRWYTDIRAWRIVKLTEAGTTPDVPPLADNADTAGQHTADDLPF